MSGEDNFQERNPLGQMDGDNEGGQDLNPWTDHAGRSQSAESEMSSENLSPSSSSADLRTNLSDFMEVPSGAPIPNFYPYRINEIIPGREWPKNLRDLMNSPTGGLDEAGRKIPVTEIGALLCHAALVEVGFVPVECDIEPLTVCTMRDPERVERLGKRVDPNGYGSKAGVFSWSYRVVQLMNGESCDAGKCDREDEREMQTDAEAVKEGKGSVLDSASECSVLSGDQNSCLNCKRKYVYSSACSVIAISSGAKIQIFCNFSGSSEAKPFQLKSQIDLLPFMESSIKEIENLKVTPEEWMKLLNFNGTKFASSYKSTFATLCLDSMNGIMFDLRGLVCLPPEVLVQIFSYSDISSIRNARLTCKYLNEVAGIPSLWRTLIRRDFGRNPSVPAARFARFFSRIPYELSSKIEDAPHDYRSIYEAQRRHNYRTRFDLVGGLGNRLGARHSWLPYVTPPRPYLFRIAYDIPQVPGAYNPANPFFQR